MINITAMIRTIRNPSRIFPSLRKRWAPLVALDPKDSKYTFSDLFVWRRGCSLETIYSCMPYVDLWNQHPLMIKNKPRNVRLVILSNTGQFIMESKYELEPYKKTNLNIASQLQGDWDLVQYGTFMLFYKDLPSRESLCGGYLADRGYVGYRVENGNTLNFVHGNLDAISCTYEGHGIENCTYTKSTVLMRRFCLQYLFDNNFDYDVAIVNPTNRLQSIAIDIRNRAHLNIGSLSLAVESLGARIFKIPRSKEPSLVTINSRVPMSRPLVFKSVGNKLVDVFHG